MYRRHSTNRSSRSQTLALAAVALCLPLTLQSQTTKAPDITRVPTLYVVPYAHLDTQWRWEMPQTISEYLLKTMRVNFDYIDRYPHYVFNWTGSNRYRLMKEYFPDDYARMTKYVAAGRWFPAGSSVEEGDVNLPGAEGIFRQILYGNEYYRKDFGKASNEYMLPDCFGFPASLPAILAHAGVKGFSTQKLNATWQPAPIVGGPNSPEQTPEGIPFNVGVWIGPDGSRVMAALNPGSYNTNTYVDLSKENGPIDLPKLSIEELRTRSATITDPAQKVALFARNPEPNWVKRIDLDGRVTGIYADYHYVGVGDMGGATQESTVKLLEAIATKSETVLPSPPLVRGADVTLTAKPGPPVRVGLGPVHVIEANADQMFNDITPEMSTRLPTYQGDLELINHSAGSLTSQAYHKRWVIKNEMLADAAEKASVAAEWMGGPTYPRQRLNDAWTLALGGHFHDTAAGTATPATYEFAWNDDVIVANQFAGVLTSATETIASGMDTRGVGVPLVISNALNVDREDLVEAKVNFSGATPKAVQVRSPSGELSPAQITDGKVLFSAKAPSVGYVVYDVVPASMPLQSKLKITSNTLENDRYKVMVNAAGDVSSIYDKSLSKELLAAPIRMAFSKDTPKQYPAWNMDYDQEQAAPRNYVAGNASIRIKENGPVRVSLEITRAAEGSKFVQTVSLATGDAGNRVEFSNSIDWRSKDANLKVIFPLTASNPNATYNEDIGTIERPNATPRQFEVFSHRWIDLTDKSGSFGATILTDYKNGSDKPTDNTIRLTLLRTPGMLPVNPGSYTDQANQDWGHHEITFGIMGHAAGWREAQADWQAYRLNDPLRAFATTKHEGAMGKSLSLLKLNTSRVRVLAFKKAEQSDEIILRMVELDGKPAADVRATFAASVAAAREVNAQEQPIGSAHVRDGALVTSFTAYQPRTFAVRLVASASRAGSITSQPVALKYDLATSTNDDAKTPDGGMDGKGNAFPAEMLPAQIQMGGIAFDLANAATGSMNAVAARGQTIQLPKGKFNRVYLLAASSAGDQTAEFRVDAKSLKLNIQDWGGFIGQWDTRLWKDNDPHREWAISAHTPTWPTADLTQRELRVPSPKYPQDYLGLRAGYIKPANVAWYASHFHTPQGLNQPYRFSYLFAYAIDLPENAHTLTLPNDSRIKIFALSVANETAPLAPAQPLFDTLNRTTMPTTVEQASR
ncbi:alpha-mannosidase [Granulicella pectinivorans]|uniref:Alpha-mannosidase n=1 Tax=Granulicella pectinivorans TaxID=474950 RepID=A0A1I6LV27_9BACT|nr:glycoside hydrolase family 38 C-terminal domain-containing protein [Granulicella pectinivorans]SFS07299.1 alpha-mannosidase [Granulicella pectinivorans]